MNECGIEERKPAETQQTTGTDASACVLENATGSCQEGSCIFTCSEGYQKTDTGTCQPIPPE